MHAPAAAPTLLPRSPCQGERPCPSFHCLFGREIMVKNKIYFKTFTNVCMCLLNHDHRSGNTHKLNPPLRPPKAACSNPCRDPGSRSFLARLLKVADCRSCSGQRKHEKISLKPCPMHTGQQQAAAPADRCISGLFTRN
jgi:hypothetical protein